MRDAVLHLMVSADVATGGLLTAGVNPDPSPQLPGGLEGKLNTLLGVFMGIVIFACVAGVLIVAALLAVAARRGTLDDHFGRLGAVAAACVLVGGASTFVMFLV